VTDTPPGEIRVGDDALRQLLAEIERHLRLNQAHPNDVTLKIRMPEARLETVHVMSRRPLRV
jgi:hypothetical protein